MMASLLTPLRQQSLETNSRYWQLLKSNIDCLVCLQRKPDHLMDCGHGICDTCRVAINSIQFNLAPPWMELTTVNRSPSLIDQFTNPVDGIELKLKAVETIRSYTCLPLPRQRRHPFAALMRHDLPYTELHSPVAPCES